MMEEQEREAGKVSTRPAPDPESSQPAERGHMFLAGADTRKAKKHGSQGCRAQTPEQGPGFEASSEPWLPHL